MIFLKDVNTKFIMKRQRNFFKTGPENGVRCLFSNSRRKKVMYIPVAAPQKAFPCVVHLTMTVIQMSTYNIHVVMTAITIIIDTTYGHHHYLNPGRNRYHHMIV